MKETYTAALYYLAQGFSVIPLNPREKTPAIASWKEYQTRKPTEEELHDWFGNGSENNIAIVTGAVSGITVLDYDNPEAWERAQALGLDETPIVKTGKGYHQYFQYCEGVGNSHNKIGLDIRGEGGYVVAPPSVHPSGAEYTWVSDKGLSDLKPASLPKGLIDIATVKKPVKELYKGATTGSRNCNLTRIAGSLVSDGLNYDEVLAVLLKVNESNSPLLGATEVEQIAKSITSKQKAIPNVKACLLKWNDIAKLDIKTEYLLEGLLPKGAITLFFGRSGIGKTSICMQIAQAVAEGISFGARKTIKTPVCIIDFENPLSVLKERVVKIGPAENLCVWHLSSQPPPPRLDSAEWQLYKQLEPGLIIVDTFRASQMGDENESRAMAVVMARFKELRENGFTVLLLHHTPKANDNTYKGSTAIIDLADHAISLEEVKKNGLEEVREFGNNRVFRLGTRRKTRYDPSELYLMFDPDKKGFVPREDPDIEKMQQMKEIMISAGCDLNQKTAKELLKQELELADNEARRLLSKGTGDLWDIRKGEKNATIYKPRSLSTENADLQEQEKDQKRWGGDEDDIADTEHIGRDTFE